MRIIIDKDIITNGDVVKAMFFGKPAKEGETKIVYKFQYRNRRTIFSTYFDKDWWNSPYKAESEEE